MLDMDIAQHKAHIEFVPLSNQDIVAIIRPELNIEKFSSFLFPHRKAKGLDEVRNKSWQFTLPNGADAE